MHLQGELAKRLAGDGAQYRLDPPSSAAVMFAYLDRAPAQQFNKSLTIVLRAEFREHITMRSGNYREDNRGRP